MNVACSLIFLALIFPTITSSAFSQASWISPNVCQPRGDLMGECRISGVSFSSDYLFSQYRQGVFHARYSVAYIYDCRGHDVEVGLFTDQQFVKFQRGPGIQLVSIETIGPISIGDRNPEFTKRYAMFEPSCRLEVIESGVSPSNQTLSQLAQEAQGQAKVLSYANTLFRLGTNWANLSSWADSELAGVEDELELLKDISEYPEDIEKLIEVVKLARKNQPLPSDLGQTGTNIDQLRAYLRGKVLDELAIAEQILAAYQEFSEFATTPSALVDAVDGARSI